jgi:hypothetical protein
MKRRPGCLRALAAGYLLAAAISMTAPDVAAQGRPTLPIPGTAPPSGHRDPAVSRPVPGGTFRVPSPGTFAPGRTAPGSSLPGPASHLGSGSPGGPAIDRIVGACFRPGDIVSANGRALAGGGPLARGKAYLVSAGRQLTLDVISRTPSSLVVKLPSQQPRGGPWRLALPMTQASLTPTVLGPEIRFCPPATDAVTVEENVPDRLPEILLALRTAGTPALAPVFTGDIDALVADLVGRGFQVLERRELGGIGMTLFRLQPPAPADIDAAVETLRQDFPAATVDVNHIYGAAAGPRRYATATLHLEPARQSCPERTSSLRIGMLDSGIDVTHSALVPAADRLSIHDFTTGGPVRPGDHGTAVAALLVGDPASSSFSGLLPQNELFAGAVLSETPSGTTGTANALVAGIDWLADNKTDLAVLALSGPTNRIVQLALTGAADRGMVLLAAAGNQGPEKTVSFPASSQWVFAISAIDAAEQLYDRANRGAQVDFVAPGVDIWVARKGGGGLYRSGTSFAVPHAAAVIATYFAPDIRSTLHGGNALQARVNLRNHIASLARDLGAARHDPAFGWGLLQPADCS